MFNVDLTIRECGGRVVVGLRGELDPADAGSWPGRPPVRQFCPLEVQIFTSRPQRRAPSFSRSPYDNYRYNPAHYRLRC